jgi:hypothetical protein
MAGKDFIPAFAGMTKKKINPMGDGKVIFQRKFPKPLSIDGNITIL